MTCRAPLHFRIAHRLVRGGVLVGFHLNLIDNFLDVRNSLGEFVRFVLLRLVLEGLTYQIGGSLHVTLHR